MTTRFFSIITASLNSGSVIENLLKSIKKQTLKEIEHFVIDGGSIDNTVDLLKKYKNAYSLIWVSEPDYGISNALNKALSMAKGQYILVLQGDDQLISNDILYRVYNDLKNETVDIFSYPVLKKKSNKIHVPYNQIRILWWYHFKTIFPHQGCFVHRRVFERIGLFRESLKIAMDYDFFYRALDSGATVNFGSFPVAIMGGQGISSDPKMLEKRLEEEILVQRLNEKKRFWRIAQGLFHFLYYPYKTRIAYYLSSGCHKNNKF